MENKQLVEMVFEFYELIKSKNSKLALSVNKIIIPLLEYSKSLESSSKKELQRIRGINDKNVDYLVRVFRGEDITLIAEDVPEQKRIYTQRRCTPREERASKETSEWNGSWDNVVDAYENI